MKTIATSGLALVTITSFVLAITIYGVLENMKCRFCCKPTRYLTNKEGVALVSAVKKLEIDEYFLYDKKSVNGYRQ